VVLLPALYLDGAIDLFEEDDPGEGVRERNISE
jgi:hypothetical protein